MKFRLFSIYSLLLFLAVAGTVLGAGDPKKKKKKKDKHRKETPATPPQGAEPVKGSAVYNRADVDPFAAPRYRWADSVFNTLSDRQKIGQLFMVAAYSNGDARHIREIDSLVRDHHIGGLIFMQGGPVRQAQLTNRWQQMARVPLLLSMDAEWGLGMRLDSVPRFPKQITLGALPDDSLVHRMGTEIAREFRRIGMHVNFAPVADVNNNPSNPVINSRSFGENKKDVTRKAIAYMRGLQENRILATGKHFPGHGDTDTDSHLALPVISFKRPRLDSLELYPFRELFSAGLGSVMVAHLYIPTLDTTTNLAATLSPNVVTSLLKNELGYRGLIFTDALNMKGVSGYYKPGEVDLKALLAGNDVLLFAENVPVAVQMIDSALKQGVITMKEIEEHCRKILRVKEWTMNNRHQVVDLNNLVADLNAPVADKLNRLIKRQAITVIRNENKVYPLQPGKKSVCLVIGDEKPVAFQKTLLTLSGINMLNAPKSPTQQEIKLITDSLKKYDEVIIAVINTNITPKKNFGFTDEGISLADTVASLKKTSLVLFANPYALQKVSDINRYRAVAVAYQDDEESQVEAAQVLTGRVSPRGKLPVSVSNDYMAGLTLTYKEGKELALAHPAEVGIDATVLRKVDSLVQVALKEEAFPGCQVLAARNGKVFYHKSFGHHTYEKKIPVENYHLYDLASLTKILSTTLAAMELADKGRLNIDKTLGDYLTWLPAGHPHRAVTIRDAMLHQAGFPAWIPFYEKFIENDTIRGAMFVSTPDSLHPWRVAEGMYVSRSVKDSIFSSILNSRLNPAQGYKYSDLGFYYMREVVEAISGVPLERFVQEKFYTPMGLTSIGYKPLDRFDKKRIVPTEYDEAFRRQLVHGDVHDQGAALLGGVSGHAGLFGTSWDVAAIMQMLLDEGQYNSKRYLQPETVRLFTRTYHAENPKKNRRGLGFDKPVRDGSNGPTFNGIFFESFGHSGFTGTFAWADPEQDIVYVFLSNRVYPVATNNKLVKMNLRSEIQKAVYQAISIRYRQ